MVYDLAKIKESQAYKDICYFVDHVQDLEIRVDIIKRLGYDVGISKQYINIKDIIIHKNKIKVAISPPIFPIMVMRYAIINSITINDK